MFTAPDIGVVSGMFGDGQISMMSLTAALFTDIISIHVFVNLALFASLFKTIMFSCTNMQLLIKCDIRQCFYR